MKRNSLILFGILVLLAVAAYFTLQQEGEQSRGSSAGESLLTYDSAGVDKIYITSKEHTIVLEKQAGTWMLTSPGRFPANVSAVTEAVGKGRALKATALISTNPANQTLYAVDSTGPLVQIFTNNNEVAAFRVGKPATSWTETYIRKEGTNEVHTVEGVLGATFGKSVNDWRDKTIFKQDQSLISDVRFQFRDTVFTLTKTDSANWTIGKESATLSAVNSFLSSFSDFQADEFIDTEVTEVRTPAATIEASGVQLRFYKRGDSKYDVQSSASPQWFTVHEWKANQVLKRRKDFVP